MLTARNRPANTHVELLAPAGNMEVLKTVIASGADAVYLGGKNLNMRMFRKDLNFSPNELEYATKYVQERNKRIFITVNSLYSDKELDMLKKELEFLGLLAPNALIVQDLATYKLIKDLKLDIPVHASVMMNINNSQSINVLEELGFERVILSREVAFEEVKEIRAKTNMELEYFIHGDMCFCHSGQCYHSGMIFGESSNRGRCLKPCRWEWGFFKNGKEEQLNPKGDYLMAVKDMCMFPFIPDLIKSGIYSFKIEGRMRRAEFLATIVKAYRKAIDAYLEDPVGYEVPKEEWNSLYNNRTRDFSSMYAFKNPGSNSIGYDGSREPKFFSKAIRERKIPPKEDEIYNSEISTKNNTNVNEKNISVRVGNISTLENILAANIDRVYLGTEGYHNLQTPWSIGDLTEAVKKCHKAGKKAIIATPRIIHENNLQKLEALYRQADRLGADGILVTNLGALKLARELTGMSLYLDYSMNIYNAKAAELFLDERIKLITAPLEMSLSLLKCFVERAPHKVEVVAHGPLPAMISEHCLVAGVLEQKTYQDLCTRQCQGSTFVLKDKKGQSHPLYMDSNCRSHVFLARELSTLPLLEKLDKIGVSSYRLELETYEPEEAKNVVNAYMKQFSNLKGEIANFSWEETQEFIEKRTGRAFGLGFYQNGVS